jgi:hypothetical protein
MADASTAVVVVITWRKTGAPIDIVSREAV